MTTPRPYIYQVGTISLTNGSAAVVGVGTSFLAVDYADTLHQGVASAPVFEVVDDTHLTLAYPWAGSTVSGTANYAITAGISATDPRRYGWLIASGFAVIEQIPADAQAARDAAQASAADANTYRAAAVAAAALAMAWASQGHGVDVTTAGTRSALHYSVEASNFSTAASGYNDAAAANAQLANDWANKAQNTDVTTTGTRSAKHWALTAADNVAAGSAATLATAVTYRDAAAASAQLANDWANKAQGADVTTTGTRSAMHWALTAADNVNAAVTSAISLASAWASQPFGQQVVGAAAGARSALHYSTLSSNQATAAAASAQLASDWSSKGINIDVTAPGTRSAMHWSDVSHTFSNTAAASAVAAAASAAAAQSSAALLANPDFGFITDGATDFQDFGTII